MLELWILSLLTIVAVYALLRPTEPQPPHYRINYQEATSPRARRRR